MLAQRASTAQPMAGRILLNTFLILCLLLCTGGECMPAWHVSSPASGDAKGIDVSAVQWAVLLY